MTLSRRQGKLWAERGRAGKGYREEKRKARAEPWGRGCHQIKSRDLLPHPQLQWIPFKQTFWKSTQKCPESEKNPTVRVQTLSEISPLNKTPLRFSLSQFPFSVLSWVNKCFSVYTFENTKVTARIRTDFLSLTLHLSFYGLWMFFFISTIYRVHLSCNKQFLFPLPSSPAAVVVPSCLG